MSRSADKAESQGVALHYEERQALPHLLRGHAVLVGQAIDNLVNNAIKYTPQGGRVDVTLDADEDYAVILVQDTGYGIPAEHLPHIFEQFFRVPDKRTRHIQGSGLGLSLVEAIARAHGGFVRAESEVGSGSLFTLGLPLKEQRPTQAPENHLVSLDLSRMVKSVL